MSGVNSNFGNSAFAIDPTLFTGFSLFLQLATSVPTGFDRARFPECFSMVFADHAYFSIKLQSAGLDSCCGYFHKTNQQHVHVQGMLSFWRVCQPTTTQEKKTEFAGEDSRNSEVICTDEFAHFLLFTKSISHFTTSCPRRFALQISHRQRKSSSPGTHLTSKRGSQFKPQLPE